MSVAPAAGKGREPSAAHRASGSRELNRSRPRRRAVPIDQAQPLASCETSARTDFSLVLPCEIQQPPLDRATEHRASHDWRRAKRLRNSPSL